MENNQNLTSKENWELKKQSKIKEKEQRKIKKILKRIALWVSVVIGISAAIFVVIKSVDNYLPGQLANNSISDLDWVKGNKDANIILIEYSDFQCSACVHYFPLIKQLVQEFGNEIGFVYRHFPLKQAHHSAELAAWSAEAAGKQDKFWEMHDMIFENQNDWSSRNAEKIFIEYAKFLNLDIEKFKKDINSKEIKNKVENDFQSGIKAGINSTPTFFLNGEKIKNPRNYDEFKNIINQTIIKNS